MRRLVAAMFCLFAVYALPTVAVAKKGGHGSLHFTLSPADVKNLLAQLSEANVCSVALSLFKIKETDSTDCSSHQYTLPDGKQMLIDLSRSSDPGAARYVLALKGSSELLSNSKPGGSESHKLDMLFALDFDSTLFIHLFDMDARLSPRKPDASGDADYILMERVYDSRNADMIRRISDAAVNFFDAKLEVGVASAQPQ